MKKIKKDSNGWQFLIAYMPITLISLPIIDFLKDWYHGIQISKLSSESSLLFIHSRETFDIMFFSVFIMLFIIVSIFLPIKDKFHIEVKKVIGCLSIAGIVFIISASLLYSEFFNYTDINKYGIHIRNGISSDIKEYKWSDVSYAKVSYNGINKGSLMISYDIYINDGQIVHAYNSEDFFNDILTIDNLMQSENITIKRQKISSDDYNTFTRHFKSSDSEKVKQLDVLLKIFDK